METILPCPWTNFDAASEVRLPRFVVFQLLVSLWKLLPIVNFTDWKDLVHVTDLQHPEVLSLCANTLTNHLSTKEDQTQMVKSSSGILGWDTNLHKLAKWLDHALECLVHIVIDMWNSGDHSVVGECF